MKVLIGADHGGFEMKQQLKTWLEREGHEVVDVGADKLDPKDDFVGFAVEVGERLQRDGGMGVLLCRNGVGMSVVANRFMGVRCALGFDEEQVRKARMDDDVNCLALPADYLNGKEVEGLLSVFLDEKFSGKERYERRLEKLEQLGELGGGGCGSGGCCGGACRD